MPRPDPFQDNDFLQLVSEAFAAGMSRRQMCEEFGVSDPGTITRWRRDARVKKRTLKIIEDRVLQITRKVDTEIATRLQDSENLTTRDLLLIRREFLGGALRAQTERADEETISEGIAVLEDNPNFIEDFQIFLAEQAKRKAADA